MTRIQRIPVRPLPPAAFAPFGEVVAASDREADYRGGGGARGWVLGFSIDGTTRLTVARTAFLGLRFTRVERHFHVTQTFIPLGPQRSVFAVAAPGVEGNAPAPADFHAFVVDGAQGYLLYKRIWHTIDRYPLDSQPVTFAVIGEQETSADLASAYAGTGEMQRSEEVDYESSFGIAFELVPPPGAGG